MFCPRTSFVLVRCSVRIAQVRYLDIAIYSISEFHLRPAKVVLRGRSMGLNVILGSPLTRCWAEFALKTSDSLPMLLISMTLVEIFKVPPLFREPQFAAYPL